jgi:hypothetical protein
MSPKLLDQFCFLAFLFFAPCAGFEPQRASVWCIVFGKNALICGSILLEN